MTTRDVILVTGSGGLVGSHIAKSFIQLDAMVVGIDNNSRSKFFGKEGSTDWQIKQLSKNKNYVHLDIDITDFEPINHTLATWKPAVLVHAAAQPSHDFAAQFPHLDFNTNALGTLNLLEACRKHAPEVNFILFSTNKVYGDYVNNLEFTEMQSRFEFLGRFAQVGVNEDLNIDSSLHSLFGVSKLYADLIAQEYGRNFGMKTTILRGGCLTGPGHSSVKQHGFLSFLVASALLHKPYNILGFKGKQVRDNLHVFDIQKLVQEITASPNYGEVFNIGGGFENSISIIEAIEKIESLLGLAMETKYEDVARVGDHRIYYASNKKIKDRYPKWKVSIGLDQIINDILDELKERLASKS